MTTIEVDAGNGPHVHALVIGVGSYPYCAQPSGPGKVRKLLRQIEPLTSAPLSAKRFSQWLLNNPWDPPVGSVEAFISAPGPVYLSSKAGTHQIQPARFSEAQEGCRRWFDRCNTNPENIAIFFFAGHGWERGQQELLMEDLGKDPMSLFASIVDFRNTALAMRTCQAHTQCFFVDACRDFPDGLAGYFGDRGRQLLDIDLRHAREAGSRDTPRLFSAALGQRAYAPRNQPSHFTESLIKTLDGLGARKTAAGWQVLTDYLSPHLNRVLAWDARQRGEVPAFVDAEGGTGAVVRTLEQAPVVPFRLGCDPAAALSSAQWNLLPSTAGRASNRGPAALHWQGKISAGVHQLSLLFPNEDYHARTVHYPFDTPCVDDYIQVEENKP
ncbi:caspase family protein [Streptomyces sp. NBC_00210]|uniref:caspase family protein n=1 Tax=Streptomyces sp. NBC_00210 TaxID=2903636 RepID=UPI003248B164